MNTTLSSKQKSAIEFFENGKNLFITGGAGCGKSYLLHYLRQKYSHLGLVVTASTGIAAVNIAGSTIHSWAGIGLANRPVQQIIDNLFDKKFGHVRRRIKQARALAIDEISMISAEIFEILDQVLRAVRENNAPMGGLQLLLFGDFLQLPPVNQSGQNVRFCFDSQAWKNLNLKTIVLEEIFRQSDRNFIKILNNLRIGKIDQEDYELLNERLNVVDKNPAIKPTILTTHNAKVEKINQTELSKIPRQEVTHQGTYYGDPTKIEFLKKNCIAQESVKLKVGAQVMMTKNTYQKEGIINGSLGIIRDFSPRKSFPIVEFTNGKILTIGPEEWLIEKFDEKEKNFIIEAGVSQIPLILSWAITIHKSQGLTLDKIHCDLSDVFTPGQAYVALSRARCLEGVFIQSINFDRIKAHQDAVGFYREVEEN